YYADRDGDGVGDATSSMESCEPVSGYVVEPGDCDDDDETIHPGADEICDDADQACDDASDAGLNGPLGAPIEGIAARAARGINPQSLAHKDGLTVLVQNYPEPSRAIFYDRDGNVVSDDILTGPGLWDDQVVAGRFHRDNVDQLLFIVSVHGG